MKVLLSAALSLLLWIAYLIVAFGYGAFADADLEDSFTVAQIFLGLVCCALVPAAYPRGQRRWWHWVLWPIVGVTIGLIAIVWLPWQIVSRRTRGQRLAAPAI